jgi:hypothetical protein
LGLRRERPEHDQAQGGEQGDRIAAAQGADAQPLPIKAQAAVCEAQDSQQSPAGGASHLSASGEGSVGEPIGGEFSAAAFGAGRGFAVRNEIGQGGYPKAELEL